MNIKKVYNDFLIPTKQFVKNDFLHNKDTIKNTLFNTISNSLQKEQPW